MAYSIKTYREAAHLSQQYLADQLGIGLSTYRAWEARNDPRCLEAIKASFYKCTDKRTNELREALKKIS